jgi:hypothetical protein
MFYTNKLDAMIEQQIRHSLSFWDQVGYDFFFHVGQTDIMMQRMQFFFLSMSVRHFLGITLPDLLL